MQNNFSLLSLFTGGDLMVLAISLILLLGSVISLVIIIEKMRLWSVEKLRPSKLPEHGDLELARDRIVAPYDKNLWFLSMSGVVAPFIGLFGTIWGVMQSFAAIGANQSTSIGVIAPGLATALGTTALGLIVAIPASVAYSYFSKKADILYDKLDDERKERKQK